MKASAYLNEFQRDEDVARAMAEAGTGKSRSIGGVTIYRDEAGAYVAMNYMPDRVPAELAKFNIRFWVVDDSMELKVIGAPLTLGRHRFGVTRATVDAFVQSHGVVYQIMVTSTSLRSARNMYESILRGRQPEVPYVPEQPGYPGWDDIESAREQATNLVRMSTLGPEARLYANRIAVALGLNLDRI